MTVLSLAVVMITRVVLTQIVVIVIITLVLLDNVKHRSWGRTMSYNAAVERGGGPTSGRMVSRSSRSSDPLSDNNEVKGTRERTPTSDKKD